MVRKTLLNEIMGCTTRPIGIEKNMTLERKQEIAKYVKEELKTFGEIIEAIAIEKNHPFIHTAFVNAMNEILNDIQQGKRSFAGIKEIELL